MSATMQAGLRVRRGERSFVVSDDPSSADGIQAFEGAAEAATLEFFDATLPLCHRMIDIGAYVGLMSLYSALQVPEVHAVEAMPAHQTLLTRNVRLNPGLAPRIALHRCAVGATDGEATLFRKGPADSGTSIFERVERGGVVAGQPEPRVPMRAASSLLVDIGVDGRTLVKLDIEGAEYAVLPELGPLLTATGPHLMVSFHPFNIVRSDPYVTALARLRAMVDAAEALAHYSFVYVHSPEGWRQVDTRHRTAFLADHLLIAKPVPRVTTLQLGFVDAVGFSMSRLPLADRDTV